MMWALDFVRALNERPESVKLSLREVFGEFAYAEFVGMVNAFEKDGYFPFFEYGLEELNYHNEERPNRWWKD